MSRHEGVSCDSCLKGNFRGRRYKCLICYDYDLCAACYEAGDTTTRHTREHPMQCILTRSDFDLYYGGEALSVEQPQAFTCPFCGKMGYTESTLYNHVSSEHSDTSSEVVCPICAALPVGEPNHVTDDFLGHLTLEHQSSRDVDDSGGATSNSRPVRRIPHPGRGGMNHGARRRHAAHMQFASSSTGFSSLSPSSRESMDPIAELLSQLSGVRRSVTSAAANSQSTSAQLQQLQMQLQLERQQAQIARQQLERLPAARRQHQLQSVAAAAAAANSMPPIFAPNSMSVGNLMPSAAQHQLEQRQATANNSNTSQFLLSRCTESNLSESEQNALEVEQADHSMFVQELLLMSLRDVDRSVANNIDVAINNLLPIEDTSIDQSTLDESSPAPSNAENNDASKIDTTTSSKCVDATNEGSAGCSGVASISPTEHLNNPSLSNARKVKASSGGKLPVRHQSQQQGQPLVVLRNDELGMAPSLMGVSPTRISGSGTQNIGGASYTNVRGQSGGGQNIVRGGSPASASSSSRARKVHRHLDDRNKSNDPPPPH